MSKDVDVALWQDYRAFNREKTVKDALDFVINCTSNLILSRNLKYLVVLASLKQIHCYSCIAGRRMC